jgi:outer membrane protein OmpA-like peptidoglycan-associated protein
MKTPNKRLVLTALAAILSGCATTAPTELVQAREAYTHSSEGLAAKLAPTEIYDAKKVLDQANKEFDDHGDTPWVRDYAYIASRKLELADVKARTERDRQTISAAVKAGVVVRDAQVKDAKSVIASTREELKDERRNNREESSALRATNSAQGRDLAQTTEQLDVERQGRFVAEQKLAGAMQDLTAIAAVKEEARGVVITLSGSVLFVTGQYALLQTAQTKLDQVAEALKAQSDDRRIVVEGHTDSRGSDAINQPLSLNRANAVRDYLISRGVVSQKISALGMGSSHPLADNDSAENRANNRRVEIVVSPASVTQR